MATDTLTGRKIAITGGARGIGLATARELVLRGATVAIGDIDVESAKQAADGVGAVAFGLDVSDPESFATFLSQAKDALGGLDVLINNAGIMPIGPLLEMAPATYKRAVDINVVGPLNGTRLALPDFVAQGSGHILNVASSAGKTAVPGGVAYCATKAAIVSLTEGARLEFGHTGVHFTCVMPAFTNTELIAGTQGVRFIKNVEPEEVAAAIADAVEKPRLDVYVPGLLAPILKTQPLLGRRLRDFLNRKLGAYDTFLKIDHTKRDAYDQRIN
ncbi:MAG TPA: SDR family oxidoreductase [Nocardioidaceae bacterium]|nr:SDR family oxidoreductase [Nocardioidaceae bacterium]